MKMTPVCPFVKASRPDDASSRKPAENSSKHQVEHDGSKAKKESTDSGIISPKCPFGYDSQSFKLGPLSCVICQALLFDSSKCVPCSHVYCKYANYGNIMFRFCNDDFIFFFFISFCILIVVVF